ncbi:hypothetical protein [Peribacillus sp. SIMBA_075]|uniref:hypothetical protein n=1 Tax=Peribacillus sp. SIMBA_075 TaxID=3085813 RepID=UPI00397C8D12
MIESINDGVLMINQNGYERMINLEYTRITGLPTDIIGKPLEKYRPGRNLNFRRFIETIKSKRCKSTFAYATPIMFLLLEKSFNLHYFFVWSY